MTGKGTAVLMYHRISREVVIADEAIYTVTPSSFEAQLRAIEATGRPVGGIDVLEPAVARGAVCLTFDDGTSSDAERALPLLTSLGLAAIFFVNPATLGTRGFLSWDALESLNEAGMDVGSHGWDHTLLDDVDDATLVRQLADSKRALEDRLKRPVTALSLPGGTGESRAPRVARELGYRLVFGSRPGVVRDAGRDGVIPRFAVRRADPVERVVGYAAQSARHVLRARARYALAGLLRRAVSGPLYEKGRALFGARMSREQPR